MELSLGFKAQDVINEGRTTTEDIDKIKTWLATQYFPKLVDEQIVLFLLASNNDEDICKRTLKAYYQSKMDLKTVFTKRDMCREDITRQLKTMYFAISPTRTDEDVAVIYHKQTDPRASNYSCEISVKLHLMHLDAILYEHPAKGAIYILDVDGTGLWHMSKIKWKLIKKLFYFLEEAMPLEVKEIHILNMVPYLGGLFALMNTLLRQDLLGKIHYHSARSNLEDFYKSVPKKCVPRDYGGDLPSLIELSAHSSKFCSSLKPYYDAEEVQWAQYYVNPDPPLIPH